MSGKMVLITGQDGFYLAQLLLSKCYVAHRLQRHASQSNTSCIDSISPLATNKNSNLYLHSRNVSNTTGLTYIVCQTTANKVSNFDDQQSCHINIGTGLDCTIEELAVSIANVVGYRGKIEFDQSKPNGTPRKLLNIEKLTALGWQAKTPLEKGLQTTYQWYLNNQQEIRCA